MKLFRKLAVAAIAATVVGAEAGAQTTINYRTEGFFNGCTSYGFGADFASCSNGVATLTYYFNTGASRTLSSGQLASVQYGSFVTSGGVAVNSTFAGISFAMKLFQDGPSVGTQLVGGPLSGLIGANNVGQLLWAPVAPVAWSIGAVDWTLDVNPFIGGLTIDPPAAFGAPSAPTQIWGSVRGPTTVPTVPTVPVPEPASVALLTAGLAALGVVARRRRYDTIA